MEALWKQTVATYNPHVIDIVGSQLVQLVFWWLPSLLYLSLDTVAPSFSAAHKIQPAPRQPTRGDVLHAGAVALRNQALVLALQVAGGRGGARPGRRRARPRGPLLLRAPAAALAAAVPARAQDAPPVHGAGRAGVAVRPPARARRRQHAADCAAAAAAALARPDALGLSRLPARRDGDGAQRLRLLPGPGAQARPAPRALRRLLWRARLPGLAARHGRDGSGECEEEEAVTRLCADGEVGFLGLYDSYGVDNAW